MEREQIISAMKEFLSKFEYDKQTEKEHDEWASEATLLKGRDRMPNVFTPLDLEGFASWVAERNCGNVVVLCGAGLSVAAGVPAFRSREALWQDIPKMQMLVLKSFTKLAMRKKTLFSVTK